MSLGGSGPGYLNDGQIGVSRMRSNLFLPKDTVTNVVSCPSQECDVFWSLFIPTTAR